MISSTGRTRQRLALKDVARVSMVVGHPHRSPVPLNAPSLSPLAGACARRKAPGCRVPMYSRYNVCYGVGICSKFRTHMIPGVTLVYVHVCLHTEFGSDHYSTFPRKQLEKILYRCHPGQKYDDCLYIKIKIKLSVYLRPWVVFYFILFYLSRRRRYA